MSSYSLIIKLILSCSQMLGFYEKFYFCDDKYRGVGISFMKGHFLEGGQIFHSITHGDTEIVYYLFNNYSNA